MTLQEIRFHYYRLRYPLEWRWLFFKDWLGPRAKSIDDLVSQGKVICHVSVADETVRQYILRRKLVAEDQAIWDEFRNSQMAH